MYHYSSWVTLSCLWTLVDDLDQSSSFPLFTVASEAWLNANVQVHHAVALSASLMKRTVFWVNSLGPFSLQLIKNKTVILFLRGFGPLKTD